MMLRLCFIVPNIKETKEIAQELETVGVRDSRVHVLGKYPEHVTHAHLHPANVLQTTHMGYTLKRAIFLALIIIAAIFILFKTTLPAGVHLAPLALGAIVTFGLVIGFWIAMMIGGSVPSRAVESAQQEIHSGHYLMMVDIPVERKDEITNKVLKNHPKVHLAEESVEKI